MSKDNIIEFGSRAGKFGEPEKTNKVPIETGGEIIDIGKRRHEKKATESQREIETLSQRIAEIHSTRGIILTFLNDPINVESEGNYIAKQKLDELKQEQDELITRRNKLQKESQI